VSVLAVIRPDSWFWPLFLHIAGAMVLVGSLTLASVYLISSWRTGSAALIRSAYLTLFYAALPGYIVFRIGAEWIIDKEGLSEANLTWIDIGYSVSDAGALLLIISLIIGGISVRRMNRGGTPSPLAARVVTGLVSLILIADLVAIWAMTTKPV
jgi:uncharacterized membrane protein